MNFYPNGFPTPDPVIIDILGHIFHAKPGELDGELFMTVYYGIEYDQPVRQLLAEMLTYFGEHIAMAELPIDSWMASQSDEAREFLKDLKSAAPAFDCEDRAARLQRCIVLSGHRKVRDSISLLKGEMRRAVSDPERRTEVTDILRTVGELTRSLAP